MGATIPGFVVAGRRIGPGHPPVIAAEIGLNHNGDLNLALRAIDAAADAGCDAVKFQSYRCEDFLDTAHDTIQGPTYTYTSQGRKVTEDKWAMFRRHEINREFMLATKRHAEQRGLIWHCTPTSCAGVHELVGMAVQVLKNGSDFLADRDLIACMARTGLPLVMSTATADDRETAGAVEAFCHAGGDDLILLHCVREYPCPEERAGLARIGYLRQRFGRLVGYSDHTEGIAAAVEAVRRGAVWIEKHFTLDKQLPGPDHWFSADPSEMGELVRACKAAAR